MRLEIGGHDAAEIFFRRTVGRAVVVGEIEMGDAVIEGILQDGAAGFEDIGTTEILPQAQRDRRQFQARPAAATVRHFGIAVTRGDVRNRKGHVN